MYAFNDPALSMNIASSPDSDAFSKVQEQLTAFGLNPRDWRLMGTKPMILPRQVRMRFILAHLDDDDLRLGVNIQNELGFCPRIEDIEMLLV